MNQDGRSRIFKKNFAYGAGAHTSGYVLSGKYTKTKTFDNKRLYDFDWVVSMQHFREQRISNTGAKSYVYGKLNELSILRFTYGREKIIADFIQPMGVRVNWTYSIGPNIALLKPVFLEVYVDDGEYSTTRIERFDPVKHEYRADIKGGTVWTEGLGQMQFRPGITAKLALNYEWGKTDDRYKMLETGLMVDLYPTELPVMAYVPNDFVFINLYASLMIGRRW